MTTKMYMTTRGLTGCAVVTHVEAGERPAITLNQTLFHAAGGGQKADIGDLLVDVAAPQDRPAGDAYPSQIRRRAHRVLDVRHAEDRVGIWHYLDTIEGLTPGTTVTMLVDAPTRQRHARLHTGGHLLADLAAAAAPGLVAVRGHHWPGEARVELEGDLADPDRFGADLQARVDAAVAADGLVNVVAGDDGIRRVSIAGGQGVPCGGTHTESVADLAGLVIRKVQAKKGLVRVSYALRGEDLEV